MLKLAHANQYEELAQRIHRMLHEAAQRGHIEIIQNGKQEVDDSNDGAGVTDDELRTMIQRNDDSGSGLQVPCEYLSPREVAAMLKLSMDMVYTMLREGEIPAIRLGAGKRQVWRISVSEFRQYLAGLRTGPEIK